MECALLEESSCSTVDETRCQPSHQQVCNKLPWQHCDGLADQDCTITEEEFCETEYVVNCAKGVELVCKDSLDIEEHGSSVKCPSRPQICESLKEEICEENQNDEKMEDCHATQVISNM